MRHGLKTVLLSLTLISLLCSVTVLAKPLTEAPPKPKNKDLTLKGTAERDSLWYEGHAYRQWIYDQNYIGDQNSNLDPEITFIEDGQIRVHPTRVYFYNDIDLATRIAADTHRLLAFYVFDHTCRDCLYELPVLYRKPEIVAKSQEFVNVYVTIPNDHQKAFPLGIMESSLTVQFFTPGLRRLRVVSSPDEDVLLDSYHTILEYSETLSREELMQIKKRKTIKRRGY
ncbi:MAG: hypothetical protein GY835_21980 [bacterium]|nr:hypothetical protein [bacterium]